MKTIHISAKCSDMFDALLREDGKTALEYSGYVPSWFPNPNAQHYGDYVVLEIDIENGRILNWKKPTQVELKGTFGKNPELS